MAASRYRNKLFVLNICLKKKQKKSTKEPKKTNKQKTISGGRIQWVPLFLSTEPPPTTIFFTPPQPLGGGGGGEENGWGWFSAQPIWGGGGV